MLPLITLIFEWCRLFGLNSHQYGNFPCSVFFAGRHDIQVTNGTTATDPLDTDFINKLNSNSVQTFTQYELKLAQIHRSGNFYTIFDKRVVLRHPTLFRQSRIFPALKFSYGQIVIVPGHDLESALNVHCADKLASKARYKILLGKHVRRLKNAEVSASAPALKKTPTLGVGVGV